MQIHQFSFFQYYLNNSFTSIQFPALFHSALAYTRAKSNQPQLYRHQSELAAAARQGEPRPSVCLQAVLSNFCGQHRHLCGGTTKQH